MKSTGSKHLVAKGILGFVVFATCIMPGFVVQAQNLCKFNRNVAQGPLPPPPPAQAVPPYFIWAAGNAGDQSTVPLQHSGLVGWTANIDDTTFAQQTQAAIANGGAYATVPLVYVFGECFGGGMIDDLQANIANPMSIVTAAFFNQRALYPTGNGTDFVWAYINALGVQNTAQKLAEQAATDDPYGWGANPNPARNGETLGAETPEYYSQAGGDNITLQRPAGEVNNVILWAGQPELVDDAQLSQLITTLLAAGYSKDNIVVFFGGGSYSGAGFSMVSATMQANNFSPTHLRVADPKDLNNVLRGWVFPPNLINPPKFLFFLAADHGCNNAFPVLDQEKNGNGPAGQHGGGPVPVGPDPWGNGGSSQLPYPPRY